MPFGFYEAELFPSRKKENLPENAGRYAIKDTSVPPVSNPVADLPAPVTAAPSANVGNIMNITIVVASRTRNEALDLIAGIYQNANSYVEKSGLSLTCFENLWTPHIIMRQKQLQSIFNGGVAYESVIRSEPPQDPVVLIMSRPGYQRYGIQLNFVCMTTAQAAEALPACHALWVLANEDTYGETPDGTAAALFTASKQAGVPAYLLLTEFEKYGKIYNDDGMCIMDSDVYRELLLKVSAVYGESLRGIPVIPVQIYGGELIHSESSGTMPDAAFYSPEGCHIPMLMSVERINTGSRFVDNDLIRDVKKLSRAQTEVYLQYGIKTGE